MKRPLNTPFIFTACVCGIAVLQAAEVDKTFQTDIPNGSVQTLALTPDEKILVGGQFEQVNSTRVNSLVQLTSTGELDPTFSPALISTPILALRADEAGKVFVSSPAGVSRLNPDGSFDSGFASLNPNGRVYSLDLRGGKLLLGGAFWSRPDCFAARVENSGELDPSFRSGLQPSFSMEGGVYAMAIQDDGKAVVGGNFNTGSTFSTLVRLNADGSVDDTFNQDHAAILYVKAVQVLSTGKVLIGGVSDSSGKGFIRRLNGDGMVDASFHEVTTDGPVEALAEDASHGVIVGGSFLTLNGASHERLARLAADGNVDTSWSVAANNVVKTILIDSMGRIIVGGAFSEIGGRAQSGIARIVTNGAFALRSLAVTASGEFNLAIKGDAGRSYIIESSPNLHDWSVFKTNIAGADGLSVSASVEEAPARFFRARQSP